MLDPAGWNIPESGCPVGPPGTPGKRKEIMKDDVKKKEEKSKKKGGYISINFTVIREFPPSKISDELNLSYDTISKIEHDNNFICEKCSIKHRFVSCDPCFVHLNHYEIDFKYVFKIPNKLLNSESTEKIIGDFLSSFEIPYAVTNISYTVSNKKGENE